MSETKHSPEPWAEDDCNVFSGPLSEKRWDAIRARLAGSGDPHPDNDGGEPLGFVAACGQNRANADADARRIVACVNACAGIPTEALEGGALGRVLEAADSFCVSMEAGDLEGWEMDLLYRALRGLRGRQ